MTLAQAKLDNAQSELMLAIMSGNEAREMELRSVIAELHAEIAPVEPDEVYSPHTEVRDLP